MGIELLGGCSMKVSYWVCSPWHTSLEQAPPDCLLLGGGTRVLDSITWQRRKSSFSDTSLRDEGREVPQKMTVIISDLCQFRKIKNFSCTWEMVFYWMDKARPSFCQEARRAKTRPTCSFTFTLPGVLKGEVLHSSCAECLLFFSQVLGKSLCFVTTSFVYRPT